jgi:hypothetical protein
VLRLRDRGCYFAGEYSCSIVIVFSFTIPHLKNNELIHEAPRVTAEHAALEDKTAGNQTNEHEMINGLPAEEPKQGCKV